MSAKLILTLIAVLCIIAGIVWILQGFNILPGSFMSGHVSWARNGAILAAIGGLLFWAARRK
jgi:hypothetical protein